MTDYSTASIAGLDENSDLGSADFERVRTLIYRRAGIALNTSKRSMVYSRLSRRLRVLGKSDFTSYLDDLEASPHNAAEWQEFVNALTTNLTSFFRESHHFPILSEHLKQIAGREPIRLWCCAASTGEEPYSIAITAMETFSMLAQPVSILATDIDTSVLASARRGIYRDEAVAKVDPALMKRYFLRGQANNAGFVRLRPEVRALVDYRPLNLLDARRWPMTMRFDAIFCRNVMIYFDKDTQRRVLQKLASHMAPHGLLFAGHSENFTHTSDLFRLQGKTVYRLADPISAGLERTG